ncbi:protein translocase subunit SecF [Methanimicrococcus blatticola]|uniref:Protein-export membrane protein SecF n=1 Tax=Methanimicrococcus blatticola TaxID=91560 RepID=A0A484F2N1_9EURY|nr:protein translocase subunit SecF [Methanimicrococcus blatticola]MBZ3935335.1 protein translocase subunit SecF [Methanimicrococcus blatticola]MCC2508567.1 protein translocase subunit SecF [Methanimicrococcus blatticola]TDQ67875.1 protein translocase subunit secF [Methanimicrococcus blatticola]
MKFELYHYIQPFVQKTDNKKLIAIPLAVLAVALLIIAFTTIQTGSPIALGMDFVGGTQFSVTTTLTEEQLQEMFSDYPLNDIRISGNRAILQFSQVSSEEYQELSNIIHSNSAFRDIEEQQVSPIFSEQLQKTALIAVVLSFIGMAVVVFILFRQVVPSLAVILSAASDIIIPIAFMDIFGIELTLGTVAALLMLIGYSVDSDILLTNKLLKRSGNMDDKIAGAMRTGLLMTTTTAAAFLVMFIVSTFAHYIIPGIPPIPLLSQISLIVLIGLLADILNTWFLNVGILRAYLTRPKSKSKKGGRRA